MTPAPHYHATNPSDHKPTPEYNQLTIDDLIATPPTSDQIDQK